MHIDCVVRPNAEQLTDCVISMLNNILEWIPPNPENVLSSEDFSKKSGESDASDPAQNQTGYDINDGNLNEGNDSERENGPRPDTIEDVNENVEENESIDLDEFNEYEDILKSLEVEEVVQQPNSMPPLLISVTTDGANVLKGRRTGVSGRLRGKCNQLLLYNHSSSHHCMLELKKTAE